MFQPEDLVVVAQVLTVPMRNGNLLKEKFCYRVQVGSYRTYEEWKPFWRRVKLIPFEGSYRTYEEWKLPCYIQNLCDCWWFLPYL